MGFKSIKKLVHRGSVTPPSESEIQKNEVRQQEKRQKEHHKAVAATKGKKVLPTNPEQEAEYRELNARMWQIEKKMQDDRAEVMKPRMKADEVVESRLALSSFQRQPLYVPDRLSNPSTAGSTPSVSSSPSTSAIGPAPLLALPAAIAEPAEPPYFPALPPAIPAAQPVRSPSPLSQRSSSVMSPSSSYQSAMEGRRMSGLRNQHFPEVYS